VHLSQIFSYQLLHNAEDFNSISLFLFTSLDSVVLLFSTASFSVLDFDIQKAFTDSTLATSRVVSHFSSLILRDIMSLISLIRHFKSSIQNISFLMVFSLSIGF
jgi:hypothetical protein